MTDVSFPPTGDAEAIIQNALAAAEPSTHQPGEIHSVVLPEGGELHEWDTDAYGEHPRRKVGDVMMFSADSLGRYVNAHRDPSTEMYADLERLSITAILNGDWPTDSDFGDNAGWRDHRVSFTARQTKEWKAWAAIDGVSMSQERFAEFIEAQAADIATPPAATVLEIANNFEAKTAVDFKSAIRLANGDRQLTYNETTDAKVGQTGTMDVPERIELGIVPFEGAAKYRFGARLRYRIQGGHLLLTVALDRPDLVLKDAFGQVLTAVQEATDLDAYFGVAPGPR